MKHFDGIVIGSGQAGPSLAVRMAGAGYKMAVIERHLFYGTCINTGCIPTKTMIASAKAAHIARNASAFGVKVSGTISVDMKQVIARKDGIVGTDNDQIPQWMKETDNLEVFKGHARFENERALRVGDDFMEADKIFINVGARASIPPINGLKDIPYLTNSDMVRLELVPNHLIIIGGGYVAVEFAQMFRRFGSEVTIIEKRATLLGREDDDVSTGVREILEGEGIGILTSTDCIGFEKRGEEINVQVECREDSPTIRGSHLLLAVGRKPNTDDLGCEAAGIALDEKGYVIVDDQLRASAEGVWALGDCNGKGAFTHTSVNDGEIVAANLLDNEQRRVSDRLLTYAIYTDPPLGRVGMTEREAVNSGRKVLAGKMPMSKVMRTKAKGDTRGFMKVLVDENSREILGAAILGTGADEAIHFVKAMMVAGAPVEVIQRSVNIHPTLSELIPYAFRDLKPVR